jgi:hypothetical protein
MPVRGRIVLVVIWLASLAAVGVWAQAQSQQQEQRVISGSELGFRLERVERDGTPTGRLVVRMNGKWVEAAFSLGVSKATR